MSECADKREQLGLRRHFTAGHIEHEPTHREVGAVEDLEARQGVRVLCVDLSQRLRAVDDADRIAGLEFDAGRGDFEGVAFGLQNLDLCDSAGGTGLDSERRLGFGHGRGKTGQKLGRGVGLARYR